MLPWIIQITVISIILIFLVHHLINFFKSTLTVPKLKDLVNRPNLQYENIYNIVNQDNKQSAKLQYKNLDIENEYTLIDLLPQNDNADGNLSVNANANPNPNPNPELKMKNELKDFLKSQLRD